MNGNTSLLDNILGAVTTISLNNTNVVLSAAQFESRLLVFNSTLTGSVTITFPTSFIKSYEILHSCTGSSAFTITLATTASGGQAVCCPPGEIFEVASDGANMRYKNFGRIGSYWDYGGSSVPNWVSGCTIPPYLNCDGTSFSAGTYPVLARIFGGTTLPDSKGRTRFALNQGSGRTTVGPFPGNGIDGNTLFAGGGAQAMISPDQLPPFTAIGTGNLTSLSAQGAQATGGAGGSLAVDNVTTGPVSVNINSSASTVSVSVDGGTATPGNILPPGYIGGLTLVRAA